MKTSHLSGASSAVSFVIEVQQLRYFRKLERFAHVFRPATLDRSGFDLPIGTSPLTAVGPLPEFQPAENVS
jgi:hypothetical protein